jgi:predicted YcjX-like family ATPase
MNTPLPKPDADLMETLAEIEHEQWMHWSRTVAADVTEATRSKWQRSWTDYAELPDDVKEADRVWARKVIAVLRQRQLIR